MTICGLTVFLSSLIPKVKILWQVDDDRVSGNFHKLTGACGKILRGGEDGSVSQNETLIQETWTAWPLRSKNCSTLKVLAPSPGHYLDQHLSHIVHLDVLLLGTFDQVEAFWECPSQHTCFATRFACLTMPPVFCVPVLAVFCAFFAPPPNNAWTCILAAGFCALTPVLKLLPRKSDLMFKAIPVLLPRSFSKRHQAQGKWNEWRIDGLGQSPMGEISTSSQAYLNPTILLRNPQISADKLPRTRRAERCP